MKHTSIYKKEDEDSSDKTANEFINVRDIKDKYLYTLDNKILTFIKIMPLSIELFSKTEKENIIKTLTAELSGIRFPFKFIVVSRPVDIYPLIAELSTLIPTSHPKQKELLKHEIIEMNTFGLSGDVVQRQFYIVLWSKYEEGCERDQFIKTKDFAAKFENCGVSCEILNQQDIVRLCNLVNNPAYTNLEDTEFKSTIPILK